MYSLKYILFFAAFDKECCKKECPCAYANEEQPAAEGTDFEMFIKMFKNIEEHEEYQESETKTNIALKVNDEERIEKAMKEVLEIIDNQILGA